MGMIHSDMARQLPVSDSLREWQEDWAQAKAQAEGEFEVNQHTEHEVDGGSAERPSSVS
jgi:hypothetical protein